MQIKVAGTIAPIMFFVRRSFTERPKGSNSTEQLLSIVKRWTEIKFLIIWILTRTWLRVKGPWAAGIEVEPTEVIGIREPLPTMILEGEEGEAA
jgi:hypothetical protein